MCEKMTELWNLYITGVMTGANEWNAAQALDPMTEQHRQHEYNREIAYSQVRRARERIEAHRRECPACHALLFHRAKAREVVEVDPRELRDLPVLEAIAEAGA